jgi:hypothetical protein
MIFQIISHICSTVMFAAHGESSTGLCTRRVVSLEFVVNVQGLVAGYGLRVTGYGLLRVTGYGLQGYLAHKKPKPPRPLPGALSWSYRGTSLIRNPHFLIPNTWCLMPNA